MKDIKLGYRLRHFKFGLVRRKPIFLLRILFKYANKIILGRDSLRGIVFASSYACNFSCSHCYATRFRDTDLPPLSLEEKIAVINKCLQLGATSFDFVGGEIGLSKDLKQLLSACKPYKTHLSLASNGYDITREKVRHLKNLGIDKISISIDSGSEQEHDQFRNKKGSYERCFEAIENIRQEGLTPVIITCISKGDTKKQSFHDLVNYAINNHVELVFSVAIPFGQWEGNIDVLCDEEDIRYMREMHKEYSFLTRDCYENMGSSGCPAVKQIIYISEYGDVMPCPFTHISFGNIRYESIRDIRERMLSMPEFAEYHPCCLAGEDRTFIERHLSKTFGAKTYPLAATEAFPKNKAVISLPRYTKNIKRYNRPCPLCGSFNRKTIATGREHEFENTTHDLFFVVKCLDCDLVYLNPRPDESTLDIIYPKEYYCFKETFVKQAKEQLPLTSIKKCLSDYFGFPRRIRLLVSNLNKTSFPISVLDVGCGNGSALDVFKQVHGAAVETTGLDFNIQALSIVAEKGHKTVQGRIEDALLPKNFYDIIYSSNVIEHVAEPMLMMRKISDALKPGGLFLCETPSFDSWDAHVFSAGGHWGGFHFPRHWTFFTAQTLRRIAEQVHLSMEKVTYHPVPIFWIWTLHSWLYRGKGRKDLADRIFPLIESKENFLKSMGLKVSFSAVDFCLKLFTGKTSLMSMTLRK